MTVEVTMEQVYQLIGELFVENKMRATIQEKQKAQLIAYAQELVKAREETKVSPAAEIFENYEFTTRENSADEEAYGKAIARRKRK